MEVRFPAPFDTGPQPRQTQAFEAVDAKWRSADHDVFSAVSVLGGHSPTRFAEMVRVIA